MGWACPFRTQLHIDIKPRCYSTDCMFWDNKQADCKLLLAIRKLLEGGVNDGRT
jgi:hypothetical protein